MTGLQRPEALGKAEGRRVVGTRFPRLEDERLLRGDARYIADIRLPGMVELAMVRSQLPHARVRGVDVAAALAAPGVVDAVAGTDLTDVQPVPDFPAFARPVATRLLAQDRVRYVGAPIAAVVAEDRYLAEDAAELVEVDLEPLPAVASVAAALAPDALPLFDDWDDNRLVDFQVPNPAVDEPFERLRVVSGSYYVRRHSPVPMECRGALAEFRDGRLTLYSSTQFPHILRTMLSYVLPLPERQIRVVAADVGGGFGGKAQIYAEEYLVGWLAMRLGRPVRYIEDRYEHMMVATHSRDKRVDIEAAVNEDGTIAAVRGLVVQNVGSGECFPNGFNESFVTIGTMTMPYKIPLQNIGVLAVATNLTPSGAYRGFGMPESTFARERIVDKIARELDVDKHELRRRMMYRDEDMPYTTATGAVIESGSHLAAFDRAIELGERARAEVRAQHAGDPAIRVGLGVATYVEGTTPTYHGTTGHWTSQDACDVRFDPDGSVTAAVGIAAIGQGALTMATTVVAEELGLPLDKVRVVMGDTDTAPYGLGAWGSRGVTVAAGSLQKATRVLREKGMRIASHMLEADVGDLEVRDGGFRVRGSEEPSVSWGTVATAALVRTLDLPEDVEPGLEARATFEPPGLQHVPDENGMINACASYANATHVAIVTRGHRDRARARAAVRRRARLRHGPQPADRRRPDPRRHRAGDRRRAARGERLRRERAAAGGDVHGLPHADRRRGAADRGRALRDARTGHAVRSQGCRRGRGDRRRRGGRRGRGGGARRVRDRRDHGDADHAGDGPRRPPGRPGEERDRVKPAPFDYARPSTLARAVELLAADEDAKVLGGGQSLVPMLNFRLARPSTLVDVRRLPELQVLERRNGTLVIGAGVSQRSAETAAVVAEACPLLPQALRFVGHQQTRSRGTVGGSLAHADPAAELTAVARALDATFIAAGPGGERAIAAAGFFLGPYTTALEPEEVLTEIRFPVSTGARASFKELSRRAGDFAMAGVAAQLTFDGDRVAEARLAATGVEMTPVRLTAAEEALAGARPDRETIAEAARRAAAAVDPRGDANATPEHRRELVDALVRRAVTEVAT